jgi:hypothetical protein
MITFEITGRILRRFSKSCGVATEEGCIPWVGTKAGKIGKDRYPVLWIERHSIPARRVAWAIHYGSIPDDMHVLLCCTNRMCVNWEHLTLEKPGCHESFAQRGWVVGSEEFRYEADRSELSR